MRDLVRLFKTLSDETRLRILCLLLQRDCCVCEVVQVLGISQASASRNLSQIYDCGILNKQIEGLWTIYSVSPEIWQDHRGIIVDSIKLAFNEDPLIMRDRRRLAETKRQYPARRQMVIQDEPAGTI